MAQWHSLPRYGARVRWGTLYARAATAPSSTVLPTAAFMLVRRYSQYLLSFRSFFVLDRRHFLVPPSHSCPYVG